MLLTVYNVVFFAIYAASGVACFERSVYLTEEDFERAKTVITLPPNGTIFHVPHDDVQTSVSRMN